MLSCDCNFDYDADWYCSVDFDFTTLKTPIRRRCPSCKKLIDKGDTVLKFTRWRDTRSDVEEKIYCSEVPLAPWYYCEKCGGLWLTLSELGFCLTVGDDIQNDMRDYRKMYNSSWKKE